MHSVSAMRTKEAKIHMMHLLITRLPPLALIEKAVGSGPTIHARQDWFARPVESLYDARLPRISGKSIAVSQMAHLFEAL